MSETPGETPRLTLREAADRTSIPLDALRKRVYRGSIPAKKIDGQYAILETDLPQQIGAADQGETPGETVLGRGSDTGETRGSTDVPHLSLGRRCGVCASKRRQSPTRTALGWREGDVVYLTPGAFDAVGCGTPAFAWSSLAVRRQLEADGMLADRGPDQLTVRRTFRGRQLRATALRAEALGFGGAPNDGSMVALPRVLAAGLVA